MENGENHIFMHLLRTCKSYFKDDDYTIKDQEIRLIRQKEKFVTFMIVRENFYLQKILWSGHGMDERNGSNQCAMMRKEKERNG